jgi:hypothetical protein
VPLPLCVILTQGLPGYGRIIVFKVTLKECLLFAVLK